MQSHDLKLQLRGFHWEKYLGFIPRNRWTSLQFLLRLALLQMVASSTGSELPRNVYVKIRLHDASFSET